MPHPITPAAAGYIVARYDEWQAAADWYDVVDDEGYDAARVRYLATKGALFSATQAMGLGDVLLSPSAAGALVVLRRLALPRAEGTP